MPSAPMPLRPSTNGSIISARNSLTNWNVLDCAPVAASPLSSVSALPRFAPVRPNTLTKPGGSAPPLLKKLLSPLATFCWLALRPSC